MLPVSYDPMLVVASVLVAIMASFTGLRLASGLRYLALPDRKREIAKSAVALGGGIWSMHFVAMMAIQLPVTIQFEALATLGSVLVAILMTGVGLLALHFGERSYRRILVAGVMTGFGIISMHYIGMAGIGGNCSVVFEPAGYLVSGAIAIIASTAAFWLAYWKRSLAQIVMGAVLLGFTVSAMHYSAMIFTGFLPVENAITLAEPSLSKGAMALFVSLASFLVCGLFLLSTIPNREGGLTFVSLGDAEAVGAVPEHASLTGAYDDTPDATNGMNDRDGIDAGPGRLSERRVDEGTLGSDGAAQRASQSTAGHSDDNSIRRIPYEVNNATLFIDVDQVRVVRADGHYTWLHDGREEYFCPRSISRLAKDLEKVGFLRTHRSYLVSTPHIIGFERNRDKASCIVEGDAIEPVPVSRSRIRNVRNILDLS